MKRKLIALLICLVVAFSLSCTFACGTSGEDDVNPTHVHSLTVKWTWTNTTPTPQVVCTEKGCNGNFDKTINASTRGVLTDITVPATKTASGTQVRTAYATYAGVKYTDSKSFNYSLPTETYTSDSVIREYLAASTSADQYNVLNEKGYKKTGATHDKPQNISISWVKPNGINGDCTVKIYDVTNGTVLGEPIFTQLNPSTSFNCPTLTPAKLYLWKIYDKDNVVIRSGMINVAKGVRYVNVDGVSNFRDLGGWSNDSNLGYIPYGLIYRSGHLNGISTSGKATVKSLGIKTELDLRNYTFDSKHSDPNIDGMSHYLYCFGGAYDNFVKSYNQGLGRSSNTVNGKYISDMRTYKDALKDIFTVLADKSNYPVVFNCSAGADRTGTLAFLIEGLLGVSFEDMTRDFELTSFSTAGNRWRSAWNGKANDFDESGVFQNDNGNYVAWGVLYKETMNLKKGSLQANVEFFLKDKIGVTEQQIKNIKAIFGVIADSNYVQPK